MPPSIGGIAQAQLVDEPAPRFDARTPYAVCEREHRSLQAGLDRLRALSDGQKGDGGELRREIRNVVERLRARFAFEEHLGHMHYLLVVRPSLEDRLAALRDEHREMLSTLEQARAQLRGGRSTGEVGSVVRALLDRFERHELDERQLLRSALCRSD